MTSKMMIVKERVTMTMIRYREKNVVFDGERWLPVEGTDGAYEVSDMGRVRGVPRTVSKMSRWGTKITHRVKGCVMATWAHPDGHLYVKLKGGRGGCLVHRLVLEAFVSSAPTGMECRHLDGNPENNALTNLVWGTRQENINDREQHRGRPGYKLTVVDIRAIKTLLRKKHRGRDVARAFGISDSAVSHIKLGKRYVDV